MDIDTRWNALSKNITTQPVALERSDVSVTHLALVWIPVAVDAEAKSTGPEPE
jgi:hypothetical protein